MTINISVTPAEQEILLDGLRAHIGQIAKWQGEARTKGDQAGFDSFGERYTAVAALLRRIEAIEPAPIEVDVKLVYPVTPKHWVCTDEEGRVRLATDAEIAEGHADTYGEGLRDVADLEDGAWLEVEDGSFCAECLEAASYYASIGDVDVWTYAEVMGVPQDQRDAFVDLWIDPNREALTLKGLLEDFLSRTTV